MRWLDPISQKNMARTKKDKQANEKLKKMVYPMASPLKRPPKKPRFDPPLPKVTLLPKKERNYPFGFDPTFHILTSHDVYLISKMDQQFMNSFENSDKVVRI